MIDLREFLRPGDTVIWGQGTGEPRTLTEALVAQRASLGGIKVFLGSAFSDTLKPVQSAVSKSDLSGKFVLREGVRGSGHKYLAAICRGRYPIYHGTVQQPPAVSRADAAHRPATGGRVTFGGCTWTLFPTASSRSRFRIPHWPRSRVGCRTAAVVRSRLQR